MYSGRVPRWLRYAPLILALGIAAIPVAQHVEARRAEAWGEAFLVRLLNAQREFQRRSGAGFAATLEALTAACPGASATLDAGEVDRVSNHGFHIVLRPADGSRTAAADCNGRPTTIDFYVALEPASADSAPRRAYASTGSGGRIFVFFDGLAPAERDMAPGGLATPLEVLGTFRIP